MDEQSDGTNQATEDEPAMSGVLREDGPAARAGSGFDPTPYLRQLRGRGGQDYLDVKWRLLWLRREHPDAEIVTEHVQIDPTLAIFKATVTIPTGGKATGYGSETAGDFADFIEKAETKAIGRALNALGYGAQFGDRNGEEGEPAPVAAAPPARPPDPARPAKSAPAASAAPPRPEAAAVDETPPPPIDIAAGRERPPAQRAGTPTRPDAPDGGTRPEPARPAASTVAAPAEATGEPEPDLAEYSWSAFWPWARGLGLNGPRAVEGLIGRATAGLTPAELRDLILAARNER